MARVCESLQSLWLESWPLSSFEISLKEMHFKNGARAEEKSHLLNLIIHRVDPAAWLRSFTIQKSTQKTGVRTFFVPTWWTPQIIQRHFSWGDGWKSGTIDPPVTRVASMERIKRHIGKSPSTLSQGAEQDFFDVRRGWTLLLQLTWYLDPQFIPVIPWYLHVFSYFCHIWGADWECTANDPSPNQGFSTKCLCGRDDIINSCNLTIAPLDFLHRKSSRLWKWGTPR